MTVAAPLPGTLEEVDREIEEILASGAITAKDREVFISQKELGLARSCLLFTAPGMRPKGFMPYTWQDKTEPFVHGRHTIAICDELDHALKEIERGQPQFIGIEVPYRHGKSQIVSRTFPPYVLGRYPDKEVILSTYAASLSEGLSHDARTIIESPEYARIFPGTKLDPKRNSLSEWAIHKRRGRFIAVGRSGSYTGKGADVLIVDDLINGLLEARSEAAKNEAWLMFDNLMTRLGPVPLVIHMGSRFAVDDVAGRIKERERDTANYPHFPKFKVIKFKARENGRALFPERYPDSWYDVQYSRPPSQVAAMLDSEPILEGGNMLAVDRVQMVGGDEDALKRFPDHLLWVRAWDLASTEKERIKDDPDYTAGAKVAYAEPDGIPTGYIADVRWCQEEAPKRDAMIKATAKEDGPAVWQGVEGVAGYKDALTTTRSVLAGHSVVHAIESSKDKVTCAAMCAESLFFAGRVFMLRGWWNKETLDDLRAFPTPGVHDDRTDSIVKGFILARERWKKGGGKNRLIENFGV